MTKRFNNTRFNSVTAQLSSLDVELPNTLALPARANNAVAAKSIAQLQAALAAHSPAGEPIRPLVLGSGSNVVLPDHVGGLTVLMQIKGISELAIEANSRTFTVGAGESWQGFVRFCVGQGLGGGIENLTLIPGTVGAAPIQNIGAYGVDVAEFIDCVEVIDTTEPQRPPTWLSRDDCQFGYRDSMFKKNPGRWIITAVRFRLAASAPAQYRLEYSGIEDELARMGCTRVTQASVSEAVARLRRAKLPDPRQHPNAGSFFKNPLLKLDEYDRLAASIEPAAARELAEIPRWKQGQSQSGSVKLAAAALIERAGLKSRPSERVRVWYRQPLVLINRGQARAADIRHYSRLVSARVNDRFGILLEQEPVQVEALPTS